MWWLRLWGVTKGEDRDGSRKDVHPDDTTWIADLRFADDDVAARKTMIGSQQLIINFKGVSA
jgi:hypothetical protein